MSQADAGKKKAEDKKEKDKEIAGLLPEEELVSTTENHSSHLIHFALFALEWRRSSSEGEAWALRREARR